MPVFLFARQLVIAIIDSILHLLGREERPKERGTSESIMARVGLALPATR
jgi:hypothetical protein